MKIIYFALSLAFISLTSTVTVHAQWGGAYSGAWSSTWNNPISATASVMIQNSINKTILEESIALQQGRRSGSRSASGGAASASRTSQPAAPAANYSMLLFRPVADSGVAKQVADTIGRDAKEKEALLAIFWDLKRSYESDAAKGRKSNNIAAALTFFLASTSMAFHQTGEPSDNVTDTMVNVLEQNLSTSPQFKTMTDIQKQKMHDWLIISGGFVLVGYLDAVKTSDAKELAEYKDLANEFAKLVLGTGLEKFNLAEIK
jgi:hypothetical protein